MGRRGGGEGERRRRTGRRALRPGVRRPDGSDDRPQNRTHSHRTHVYRGEERGAACKRPEGQDHTRTN
eukprot:3094889-Prymnesium_polylepis.1